MIVITVFPGISCSLAFHHFVEEMMAFQSLPECMQELTHVATHTLAYSFMFLSLIFFLSAGFKLATCKFTFRYHQVTIEINFFRFYHRFTFKSLSSSEKFFLPEIRITPKQKQANKKEKKDELLGLVTPVTPPSACLP